MESEIDQRLSTITEMVRQIAYGKKKSSASGADLPLRTGDVARLLNIHTNTVRRWSRQGILKTYRVGPRGDRRFMRRDVINLLHKLT